IRISSASSPIPWARGRKQVHRHRRPHRRRPRPTPIRQRRPFRRRRREAGGGDRRPVWAAVEARMSEFVVAIGLVLAIEGLIFAAFPGAAKRLAAQALESPENTLRIAGVISAVLGVLVIWLVRG